MNQQQEGPKITITGKPAIAIIILVAVFFLWRILVTNDTVAPELEERVRQQLAAEYARFLLPSLQEGVAARDEARLEADVERLKAYTKKITFTSLKSRGGGNNLYVRAEILVDGKSPPTGKSLRYLHFHESLLLGYVYQQEAWALEYYFPFMNE